MKKFWLESSHKNEYGDFPFYNDKPFALSWWKWIVWFVVTVGAFLIYTGDIFLLFGKTVNQVMKSADSIHNHVKKDLNSIILVAIFLLLLFGTFWLISKHDWRTLFRKLHKNEVWFAIIGGPVGMLVIVIYSQVILKGLFGVKIATDAALELTPGDAIVSFVTTVFQLIGEEMGAIVPFLFILMVCHKLFHWNRNLSIWIAWILSSVIFGIYHLTAYDGSWVQVIFVIGVSRLFLTVPYIRYKNIWASYLLHLSYDFLPLLVAVIKAFTAK